MNHKQREFDFVFTSPPCQPCNHYFCYETHAVIPAGLVCAECGELVLQYIPESPDQLGYVSADWAYLHGLDEKYNEGNYVD